MPDEPAEAVSTPAAVGVPDEARCLECGYSLRGLTSAVCPECGLRFDPADPLTFRLKGVGTLMRFYGRPPSWWECAAPATLALLTMMGASGAAGLGEMWFLFLGCMAIPVWMALFVIYVCRVAASRSRPSVLRNAVQPRWRWWRFSLLPLCFLALVSIMMYPWPLEVRFALSRGAFDAAVVDLMAGKNVPPGWIGLYDVDSISVNRASGVVKFETGSSIADPVGFFYDPSPGFGSTMGVRRMAPRWYTYED